MAGPTPWECGISNVEQEMSQVKGAPSTFRLLCSLFDIPLVPLDGETLEPNLPVGMDRQPRDAA